MFVHLDTNFLNYGPEGEESKPEMKVWFEKLGWNDSIIIQEIE